MGIEELLALIPLAQRGVQAAIDLYGNYERARATLNETDRAKLDAALEAAAIAEKTQRLQTLLELAAAEAR